ncbi:cell division protein FtsQ/DivIB [soil metagenome]
MATLDSMTNSAALQPEIPMEIRLMNVTANVLFVVAAAALLALCIAWVMKQPVFAIHGIRIDGDTARNSETTIRANAAPHLSGTMFTLDLAAGRAAFESVPWVRHAVLRRVWPNRLAVSLEEHRPAAFWGDDKLLNVQGEVFEANLGDVEEDSLPSLSGPDGSATQVLAMYRKLVPMFKQMDATVDTLALTGRGSWTAELDTGAELELGRGSDEEVLARTERFLATVPQVTGRYQRALEYADLRHNSGYAVRLRGITTTETAPNGKTARN